MELEDGINKLSEAIATVRKVRKSLHLPTLKFVEDRLIEERESLEELQNKKLAE